MSALVKIDGMYYFRLRIPKDVRSVFPYPEIKKSIYTTKYMHAKGLVRGLLGKTEMLFMLLRSKSLDDSAVAKINKGRVNKIV